MLTRIMLPLDDQRRASEPLSYIKARMYDTLWMMDFYFSPDTTPMWVGWNSIIFQNTNNLQKVWYLPQINQSPTSIAVVAETLRRAQVIANECGKKNISVTYDLAIAKVAMQLQAEESPKFDNIFVALGAFHVEMAMFSASGKYIAESGGPHILNEAGVIEKGSLKSFLLGKCYKRSKRCHQILALAMEILHFQYFLQEREEIQLKEDIQEEIKFIKSQEPLNLHEGHEVSKEVNNVLREYSQFRQDTEKGNHGATAQYWMGYVEMIRLYHDFSRSLRDGNFDLYVCCLPKVANYFFSMNHPNYARWIVRYHDNLLKLKDSHPEVYTEFQRGLFSLRRTQKSFSRLPIDLTLEQTINADAACQRKGISALTNSISARQRWAQSHSIRTSIVSYVFENLGMTKQEDVSQDLKASRMRQNSKDLHQVINMVKETMNPFNDAIEKQYLFNIASGKAASPDTTKFLLNIVSVGSKARDKFIDECSKDPARFEKPIRRQTLHTFATGGTKYNIKAADNKVVAVTMMRDLFGSILYHSLQRKIDMAEVLKYPLTPVPLSLGHVDGKMQKTPKVKLLNELEAKVKTDDPNRVDVNIIDGMFFLHLFVDLPATFGALATFILKRVCASKGNIIHFVLDKMVHPSIKDCERDLRCTERHGAYQITGPEQKRPSNWLNALRNDHFKAALVEFLAFFWENNMHSTVLGNKTVIMNRNDTCYMFRVEGEIVVKTEIVKLFSTHEEADSRILYHLSSIQTPANVVIRTIDTDVLIIALGCLSKLPNSLNIWMETGVYTKNTLRYISINQIYQKLGKNICMALPAYHAFTGCDYTASFSRKGKIRPFKLLEKNESVQDVFKQLGTNLDVTDDAFATLEKFVCSMYGKRNLSSVDEARLVMFLEKYKPKGENEAISCVKKFDGSSLPPCLRVLRQKIYRTKYVAQLWMSSITSEPPNHLPEDMGWLLKDGSYIIKWYEGEMSPKAVDVTSNENYYGFSREVEDFEGFDELSSDDDSDSDDETSDEDV
ncbi:uncharacterized protein LOC130644684 [Hydractinia symbiolongicarpus]|uniref:uncharacterized protein LOC130644684 n=1 Tax=Hydractinia symbiolongicarpus TaxID=13093 RepID=UPI00254A2192|nr:uncharacterized protein LOC130644684 [Hydractinia symbiolongicarpus]